MPRVAPKKMSHVVYRTNRYDEMITWYQEVFGARIKSRSPAIAFLTFDDEDHRFAIGNIQAMKLGNAELDRPGLVGVDHIAYTLESVAGLFGNYEYLKAKGIVPYWCIHHGDTVSMYYADPDGNQMEFQVETLEAQKLAPNDPNPTPRPNNPIGVEFDPDYWLERLRAGAPDTELLVRTVHEPISPVRGAFERG
jgi:catechol 2,3-dioxygenase-like lactoylglutathione lyase family enzyme